MLTDSLIEYAKYNLFLDELDESNVRSRLNEVLTGSDLNVPSVDIYALDTPDILLKNIQSEDLRDTVMDILTPYPSQVNELFNMFYKKDPQTATDFLFDLGVKNYYIKKEALKNNIRFDDSGGLVITVNLSKPEKDNAQTAALLTQKTYSYPKCPICYENEGCYLSRHKTLRTVFVPIKKNELWFWQYSPYGYFDRHGILVSLAHTPMKVDADTLERLAAFVDLFPHFFIGSNAALPRIGGSILAHDHYQGGAETLPMHRANTINRLSYKGLNAVAGVLDWYNSAVRITSTDKAALINTAVVIMNAWNNYSNQALEILCRTEEQHNSCAPVMRKQNGAYILDIILRNNRVNDRHPGGIFHAHSQYFPIKSESIGLIEAQGLFILPPRLKRQLGILEECLVKNSPLPQDMAEFKNIQLEIIKKHGTAYNNAAAQKAIRSYIGYVCVQILDNTAVFKQKQQTTEFLKSLGFTA